MVVLWSNVKLTDDGFVKDAEKYTNYEERECLHPNVCENLGCQNGTGIFKINYASAD